MELEAAVLLKIAQARMALETKGEITNAAGRKGVSAMEKDDMYICMEHDTLRLAAAAPSLLEESIVRVQQSLAIHKSKVQTYMLQSSRSALAIKQKEVELTSLEENELLSYCTLSERSLDDKNARIRLAERDERVLKDAQKMNELQSQVRSRVRFVYITIH